MADFQAHSLAEGRLVAAQIGRAPREPWRTAAVCSFGYPTVIASPSLLADGTPFPTLYWLTCPHLSDAAGCAESEGRIAQWAARASADEALAAALRAVDESVRTARAAESRGVDACAATGIAGQRDPLGVKCLHAHAALALAGIADPIGAWLIEQVGAECAENRCARFVDVGDVS